MAHYELKIPAGKSFLFLIFLYEKFDGNWYSIYTWKDSREVVISPLPEVPGEMETFGVSHKISSWMGRMR